MKKGFAAWQEPRPPVDLARPLPRPPVDRPRPLFLIATKGEGEVPPEPYAWCAVKGYGKKVLKKGFAAWQEPRPPVVAPSRCRALPLSRPPVDRPRPLPRSSVILPSELQGFQHFVAHGGGADGGPLSGDVPSAMAGFQNRIHRRFNRIGLCVHIQ